MVVAIVQCAIETVDRGNKFSRHTELASQAAVAGEHRFVEHRSVVQRAAVYRDRGRVLLARCLGYLHFDARSRRRTIRLVLQVWTHIVCCHFELPSCLKRRFELETLGIDPSSVPIEG